MPPQTAEITKAVPTHHDIQITLARSRQDGRIGLGTIIIGRFSQGRAINPNGASTIAIELRQSRSRPRRRIVLSVGHDQHISELQLVLHRELKIREDHLSESLQREMSTKHGKPIQGPCPVYPRPSHPD
eukprot:4505838-Pyramimonas_sp.AAC.1